MIFRSRTTTERVGLAPAFIAVALLLSTTSAAAAQVEPPEPDPRDSTALVQAGSASDSATAPARDAEDEPGPSENALQTDEQGPAGNPFTGFETHFLSNGVKLWFKRLDGAPDVSVSVGVPYGWDRDPEGKEELAHFTEHMLFSDHRGVSEKDIKDAVELRGGRRNGVTNASRTWYYVTIEKEHGLFALEWLSRLMEPHAMEEEVVDRNREPVALEIGAKPREVFEQAWWTLNPSWLRLPDYWKREFGLDTRAARRYDRWANLQSITRQDLLDFYDRYYVPSKMTVTVIGDLDRDEVLGLAQATFGNLVPRTATSEAVSLEDPGRRRATYSWEFRPNVRYEQSFKVFDATAEGDLYLTFAKDLLRRRLSERLRFGERKAVYAVSSVVVPRGPARVLRVSASINEEEYEYAREVIENEFELLRTGAYPAGEFESDRQAITERLRGANLTSEALNNWAGYEFWDPEVHRDFPDVVGFYEDVTPARLAGYMAPILVPERETLRVAAVHPFGQGVSALGIVVAIWLTLKIVAWFLTSPIKMPDLKYVARFRTPFPLAVLRILLIAAIGLVGFRFLIFGFEWSADRWIEPMDVFWGQLGAYAGMVLTSLTLLVLYLSRVPRKLLVFPDHIRIKGLAYRSRVLVPEDVEELSLRRFPTVWLNKRVVGTSLLSFGLLRPGIYLRPSSGRAYYFRSRATDELMALLQAWLGAGGAPKAGAEPEAPRDDPPPPPDDDRPPDDSIDVDSLDIDDPELEALLRANP